MKSSRNQTHLLRKLMTTCLLGCLLSACAVVGPAAIHSGRLAYNEAIIETDNRQMLLVIVRNRYGERSNLLAVSSVTANVRVVANAGVDVGVGDNDDYAGNLVPVSAGVLYEENPTVSYTPVGGAQYSRQLMFPISVAELAQLAGNLVDPTPVYFTLVSSINGIYNPSFLSPGSAADARFVRVATIMSKLTQAHRLHWIQDPQQGDRFSILINHYSPDYSDEVEELLTLLGMPALENPSERVVLPVSLLLDGQDTDGIGITTRSVFNLLDILSGAVEVPQQDQAAGVAVNYPPPGMVGKQLRIRRAEAEPEHASVAVSYRDGWFYIDENDQATKQFFRLMSTLLSINIADSASSSNAAPVLTVPVSR